MIATATDPEPVAVGTMPQERGASASFRKSPGSLRVSGRLRNRGFFDDDGHALPVMNVFDRQARK